MASSVSTLIILKERYTYGPKKIRKSLSAQLIVTYQTFPKTTYSSKNIQKTTKITVS